MKKMLLLLCLVIPISAWEQTSSISFSFTIPPGSDLRTSAAVLDSTGTMIRTLWGNVKLPPGTYTRQWDGTFDQGGVAPSGSYTIKLLTNDVRYHYDWWIGNTDAAWSTSPNPYGRFHAHGLARIAWVGSQGWIVPSYAERIYNFGLINKNTPNAPYPASVYYNNYTIQTSDAATDGTWVYLANHGYGGAGYPTYITVMDGVSGRPMNFTNGIPMSGLGCNFPNCANTPAGTYYSTTLSTIDYLVTTGSITTGTTSLSVAEAGGVAYPNGTYVYVVGAGSGTSDLATSIQSGGGVSGPATLVLANAAARTVTNGTVYIRVPPTGIAVQKNGNVLAVAHGSMNQIVLFDKKSGSSLGAPITGITAPAQMAFNSEGLWVVAGGALYEVTGVGSSNTVTAIPSLGGFTFSNVQSVAVNKATDSLVVLDGGIHQQVYEFAVTTHNLMRTYGDLGGYNDCNPTITPTRLNVDNTATTGASTGNGSFVSVDDNDELWIGDIGTYQRVLHISASNKYVNQILSPHYNYKAFVSHTMPTRLFMHQWEYAINYNVTNNPGDPDPALGGTGSWQLVKNWGVCALGAKGSAPGLFYYPTGGIMQVEQLSNGRVYGVVQSAGPSYIHIFEFPSNGTSPLRDTGVNLTSTNAGMLRNGNLVYSARSGSIITAYQQVLTGFDSSNNPLYAAVTVVGSTTTNASNSSLVPSGSAFIGQVGSESTISGYVPVFWTAQKNNSATTHYPHLAGIATTGSYASYAWTTLGEVCMAVPDYLGNFPCGQGYGGHNGFGPIQVEGANIFVGYDGQNVSWGDQYYHVWEDGMIVGQFGNNQWYLYMNAMNGYFQTMRPEGAENIGNLSTTVVNGDIYLYHPDEAAGSCHRWHISNLSSIQEFAGSALLAPGSTATLVPLSQWVPPSRNREERKEERKERRKERRKGDHNG